MFRNMIGDFRFRIAMLGILAVLAAALLLIKLYHEQISRGEEHIKRISRQSVRRIRIPAKRGKIMTSDLKLLAGNDAGCMIVFYPAEMRRPGVRSRTVRYIYHAAAEISKAMQKENPLSREEIARHLRISPGLPLILFRGLTPAEAAPALPAARNFEGVGLEEDDTRIYPQGKLASHLIGYTRRENPRSASDRKNFSYYIPDQVGRAGMEKQFDSIGKAPGAPLGLRGIPGYSLVMVDILGFIRNAELDRKEPVDGNHLILTIDSKAQILAEKELQGVRGAFILMDADTGAVLAMASSPSHDLSRFTPHLSTEYYRQLLNDPDRPLINRPLHGLYTPGSIIKVLVSMALLENGTDPAEKIYCSGKAVIGSGGIRCAARAGHGPQNITEAIQHSCNVYFIEEGCRLGRNTIAEMFSRAGLGRSTGFDLPDRSGLIPSEEYKLRYFGRKWNKFDTAQISIGQGILLLTPVQAAVYTAAIANGGRLMRPFAADRMVDHHGRTVWRNRPEETGRLNISPEILKTVRDGMFRVVNSADGSGRKAGNSIITLYGKTGSAEVGPRHKRTKNTWFIAFGTHNGKTYAAAMLVEEGSSGGGSCAPRVADFFEKYLTPER